MKSLTDADCVRESGCGRNERERKRNGWGMMRRQVAVPDGWNDTGEGPWAVKSQAELFAKAEVGIEYRIVKGADGKWYILTKE